MRLSALVTIVVAAVVQGAYPGDIVQYWVDQSAIFVNGTVITGLQSPPSGWFEAIVQGAVYLAATGSHHESLAFQQLAVSNAAHDTLLWTFHGTRLYATVNSKLRAVLAPIGIDPKSEAALKATEVGRKAAKEVITARADDGINNFIDFTPLPPSHRPLQMSMRQNTKLSYCSGWNRFASLVVGNKLATDVQASAKFYAQLNYALANAAIASWDSEYFYNTWRPVTAIRRPGVWLKSGKEVTDPTWDPLLLPTPNHQDYLSTHATFGAAAGAVIRAWNKGDKVDVYLSSNVTVDNVGVVTRRITSLKQAVKDNGDSRVFGGVHFQYASDEGRRIGDWVGRETLAFFDRNWDNF